METITSIATAARNSVFGETATATHPGVEPPTDDTSGKGTADAPYDSGNVPEQVPTQSGTEPPSGGSPGRGTAEAPFDRGNEPEQIQVSGLTTDTAGATDTSLPSNTTPASKIDNPDPSIPSDMKSAVASNEATNTINKATSNTPSTDTESKAKKIGTAKPGSHSALFGLGPKDESSSGGSAARPPKGSGELSGTIDEAGEVMGQQAEIEKRGADEDDAGGYVGLKKAAMEEEEKKKNGGGGAADGTSWTGAKSAAAAEEEEERDPSTSSTMCSDTSYFG
jgi:hypothetical protein